MRTGGEDSGASSTTQRVPCVHGGGTARMGDEGKAVRRGGAGGFAV
jgi:hypothetical protein